MHAEVLTHPPRTLLEVFKSLPEGTPVQLIENELVMSPAPLDRHQIVLNEINFQILIHLKQNPLLGQVRISPYDVYLDERNVCQPDILFISKGNLHLVAADGLHGAPDLIIEILSPSSVRYDLEIKRGVYERHGVKEYWVVDPATRIAQGFFLVNGIFEPTEKRKGVINSGLLVTEIGF